MITQRLSSGIVIKQRIGSAVRAAFYQTEMEEFLYATDGGTLFVVYFRGRHYGLTCRHVFGNFRPGRLFITQDKQAIKGTLPAPVLGLVYPSEPTGAAVGSDIGDICVIEFADDLPIDFFRGNAYVIDGGTIGTAVVGHELLIHGVLKDKSDINPPDIAMGYCQLQMRDVGVTTSDSLLRQASALFDRPTFNRVAGLSGAPVFDQTAGVLCGMVARGGMNGSVCNLYYFDIADIVRFLDGVADGKTDTFYEKQFPPGSIAVRKP
jgi:hypothetical protein